MKATLVRNETGSMVRLFLTHDEFRQLDESRRELTELCNPFFHRLINAMGVEVMGPLTVQMHCQDCDPHGLVPINVQRFGERGVPLMKLELE